jgi:hypothetical protein
MITVGEFIPEAQTDLLQKFEPRQPNQFTRSK